MMSSYMVLIVSLQDDMNLTEEKKAPLRMQGTEQKKTMLAMQFKSSIQVGSKTANIAHSTVFINCI